jgi:hypothetical protein
MKRNWSTGATGFIGGDLAHFDADGYLIYHGRNDDVMNAMGYRVSPLEVEQCLSRHPAVAEVAVTELAVVREGVSVIAAFVVPRDPDEIDAAPLLAYAHEHLAAYKCPREIIFIDTLPRTANGKVKRRDLAGGGGKTDDRPHARILVASAQTKDPDGRMSRGLVTRRQTVGRERPVLSPTLGRLHEFPVWSAQDPSLRAFFRHPVSRRLQRQPVQECAGRVAHFSGASWTTLTPEVLTNLAAGIFILPFFLFSATAGQLADKYDKARLARLTKLLEIVIMGVALLGFMMHSLEVLLLALFLLGLQSRCSGRSSTPSCRSTCTRTNWSAAMRWSSPGLSSPS